MLSRQPYQGLSRKLVLAFDVGTTYSGVSYCILDPGQVPEILGVSRYPAQEHVGGDNKIPSILYYDQRGDVRAVGAEALQQHIVDQAEEENWTKLEWWKLHLRAKHLGSSHIQDGDIPPLPQWKSAVQVLADFMQYLFECTRNYITEAHASGASMWKSVEGNIEFVLTHPNGWEGPQQQQIRRAAELAGLVPTGEQGQARIHLLNEGEASLHFCVTNVLASDPLANHQDVVIIDAGGGTIDLSAYSMKLSPPTSFEEFAPAECRLQGSVFVTNRAHAFLKAKLANSRYGAPEIVQQMKDIFDKSTKLRFRNAEDPQYIKFGTVRDKEPEYDIRSGQLKLAGEDIAKFFEPSVEAIAGAFEQQQSAAATRVKVSWSSAAERQCLREPPQQYAFLVGGYAASDFLYASLREHPVFSDVNLCRPGNHVNKAVADGGVSFYIDHLVSSRTARFTYGARCSVRYESREPEHIARKDQGTRVSEEQEFHLPFCSLVETLSQCSRVSCGITAYRGELTDPDWVDLEPLRADTTKLAETLRPRPSKHSPSGTYYSISYEVILLFGLTELKAQLSWMENCRFPATERVGGNSKIPSIVYYDQEGTPRAFGGEALQESIIEKAEDEGWTKLEWWKLHLRPRNMPSSHVSDQDIPALPASRTAVQILADFMKYLFQCAKTYIEETHASGREMWMSFDNNIDFVLSHPNGWEGPQQTQIRRAAVLAGLVPDSPEGQARIQLVTEGEASLHFCLGNRNAADGFKDDQGVIIVDAGGGTIDVSSYYLAPSPASIQEISPAECRLQGSVFVSRRAKHFLINIDQMTSEFDKTTKLRFSNPADPSYIRFGTVKDRDLAFDIKSGQLKLPGTEVAKLFEPSVEAIIAAVDNQRKVATKPISSVFLVGGFAASDWLFSKLQEHIKPLELNFCRPDSHTNKAVADGAIAFYLDHRVSARVAKFTYGTRCAIEFNKNDEQHKLRAASAIPRPSGRTVIPNAFSAILNKGTAVSEAKEFRKDFITECAERTSCDTIATEIVCYRGHSTNPRWTDSEPGMFSNLCTVHADTSQVSKTLSPRRGFAGLQFYRQQFSIVLMFGLTELQAQIIWVDNGEEKR
ncbi:hypothetical protein HYDPIDRAFT_174829 [Hydnomerulius pinastri MD-312]|nr:hypothetical protein HYDPIDRAFT_174829 [Hydnomerulius pinastri MD-312]